MKILIVAIEDERWGPPRLPKALAAAGFEVAALCPATNALAASRHLGRHFELPRSRAWLRLAPRLLDAMRTWQPSLVIPADEQVVALLQFIALNPHTTGLDRWPQPLRDALALSLGQPSSFDAMLRKNSTQELARRLGVETPAGMAVANFPQAREEARRLGYPVVLKRSFSWGGTGVRICRDESELQGAVAGLTPCRGLGFKSHVRWLLSRDWYPDDCALWLQSCIVGSPAMYTAVARSGRMLAGFAGVPVATNGVAGPSTVVEIGPHETMADASRRLIEAMGATGFLSFDFMIEHATGRPYLLECNPRPNQVSHLGPRVGVDLCQALREALLDTPALREAAARTAVGTSVVALFPAEWKRAPGSRAIAEHFHDVPWDEPELALALAAHEGWPDRAQAQPLNSAKRSNFIGFAQHSLQRLMINF